MNVNIKQTIPAAVSTLLLAATTLGSSDPVTAGFDPTFPGFDDPTFDVPPFPGACNDEKSPNFGWCLPDLVAELGYPSAIPAPFGSGTLGFEVRNDGTRTTEPLWSTIRVTRGEPISVSSSRFGTPGPDVDIHRSWFDTNVYFVEIPDGLDTGEHANISVSFVDHRDISVEVTANFHSEAEALNSPAFAGYRIEERTLLNNVVGFASPVK